MIVRRAEAVAEGGEDGHEAAESCGRGRQLFALGSKASFWAGGIGVGERRLAWANRGRV